jgi:hypothetical protein
MLKRRLVAEARAARERAARAAADREDAERRRRRRRELEEMYDLGRSLRVCAQTPTPCGQTLTAPGQVGGRALRPARRRAGAPLHGARALLRDLAPARARLGHSHRAVHQRAPGRLPPAGARCPPPPCALEIGCTRNRLRPNQATASIPPAPSPDPPAPPPWRARAGVCVELPDSCGSAAAARSGSNGSNGSKHGRACAGARSVHGRGASGDAERGAGGGSSCVLRRARARAHARAARLARGGGRRARALRARGRRAVERLRGLRTMAGRRTRCQGPRRARAAPRSDQGRLPAPLLRRKRLLPGPPAPPAPPLPPC